MTATRRSPLEESKIRNLLLFLITLPRTAKSQEIFRSSSLCHIVIRVEAYRAKNGLTECHNCQQFGHVWANYKQPPRCLWCGGGHLYKECPEKENTSSTTTFCNCRLAEGENSHPANYRGAYIRRRCRKRSRRGHPGLQRVECSLSISFTPGMSFAAALRGKTGEQQQPRTHQVAGPDTMEPRVPAALPQHEQQKAGQSVQAPNVNSLSLDKLLKAVVTVTQQLLLLSTI
jgi:hypothetical protein